MYESSSSGEYLTPSSCACYFVLQTFLHTRTLQQQVGQHVYGAAKGQGFGGAVAISALGNRLVADASDIGTSNQGQVRVYDLEGNSWVQTGSALVGGVTPSIRVSSVATSASGDRVVVAMPYNYGRVLSFEWSPTVSDWTELGRIQGTLNSRVGDAVALSADGSRLATLNGPTRLFDWNGTAWGQTGADIPERDGESLALSSTGHRVVIGSPSTDGPAGTDSGQAAVYELLNGNWALVGSFLNGATQAGEWFGSKVSMSGDGTRVAVVSKLFNNSTGVVRVYEEVSSVFYPVGQEMHGATVGEEFGKLSFVHVALV
jgi:hypothetical protein